MKYNTTCKVYCNGIPVGTYDNSDDAIDHARYLMGIGDDDCIEIGTIQRKGVRRRIDPIQGFIYDGRVPGTRTYTHTGTAILIKKTKESTKGIVQGTDNNNR